MSDNSASNPGGMPANNRLALRRVMRACRKASLATLTAEGGAPYASLVTVALDHDCSAILLLSGLSDHTRNIRADARVSLLFDGTEGHPNPQTGPRVTLMGRAEPVADDRLKARFLARHPGAALYAGFGDFGFWRVVAERAHFVGGFGRAVWFDAPFGLPLDAIAAMRAAEPSVLEHMNADHGDAVRRMAVSAGGEDEAGWLLAGVDPDGVDLCKGEHLLRLDVDRTMDGASAARTVLMDLVRLPKA